MYLTEKDRYKNYIQKKLEFEFLFINGLKGMKSFGYLREFLNTYFNFRCARRMKQRAMFKDPIAVMSVEWLVNNFNFQPVVLIRHPLAFAGSLKRLNLTHPFKDFLKQEKLMDEVLAPFKKQIEEYAANPPDIISQAILLWNIIHFQIKNYKEKNSDWYFIRHEDLSANPVKFFQEIFDYLEIEFTGKIKQTIISHTHPANPKETPDNKTLHKRDSKANIYNWKKRLSEEEIERVEKGTEKLRSFFYDY